MMNFLNLLLCYGSTTTESTESTSSSSSWWIIIVYIVIFGAFIYFIMIRPSRKQKKQQEATMNSLEPGDSVLTTSGFYGTVVAVTSDTVIVEFGSNKNCRIPMTKTAIAQVEKANAPAPQEQTQERRGFFKRKSEQIEDTSENQAETPDDASSAEQDASEDASSSQPDVSADASGGEAPSSCTDENTDE